jgi:MtN3 and saliva related transmembrane protein
VRGGENKTIRPSHKGAAFPPFASYIEGMHVQALGWVSSLILVLTIGKQVWKQWQEGATDGISKWLFIGQTAASTGFTIYSLLVRDWVFVVTNVLMLMNGLAGYVILMRNRRKRRLRSSMAARAATVG